MNTSVFIGPDLLFSYWIFAWFLVYYIAPLSWKIDSPRLIFCIALIENLTTWILLLVYGATFSISITYLLVIILIKGIPLWIMRKDDIHWTRDLGVLIFIFLVYNLYLWIRSTNIVQVYRDTFESIVAGSNKTPLLAVLRAIR
jgi:hypothetical protein